jgi:Protein phosphatase 2C
LEKETIYPTDVLVMGTDGLWDVTSNEKVADVVHQSLEQFPSLDTARHRYRFTSAAQDLVMASRGKLVERNWRTAENKSATIDDISVFVIPLIYYKEEYQLWKEEQEAFKNHLSNGNASKEERAAAEEEVKPTGYVSFGDPSLTVTDPLANGAVTERRKSTEEAKDRPPTANEVSQAKESDSPADVIPAVNGGSSPDNKEDQPTIPPTAPNPSPAVESVATETNSQASPSTDQPSTPDVAVKEVSSTSTAGPVAISATEPSTVDDVARDDTDA